MKKILYYIVMIILGITFFSLPIIAGIACEYGILGLLCFGVFGYLFVKLVNNKKFNEMIDEYEK